MSRRRRWKKKREEAEPGAWRKVLADNPLRSDGRPMPVGAADLQREREKARARPTDWFARRGARHL